MSDNITQLNEDLIKHDRKDLVRSSVEIVSRCKKDFQFRLDYRSKSLIFSLIISTKYLQIANAICRYSLKFLTRFFILRKKDFLY